MIQSKRTNCIALLGICFILLVGLWQKFYIPFNNDISFSILTLHQLLAGKHYYTSFINTNPPLTFYIYLPVLLLQKILHIHVFNALRLYIFIVILFSLYLMSVLLSKLLDEKIAILRFVLLAALAFGFSLLPNYEFGQRAHIAIMLILPYLCLLVLQLKNIKIKLSLRILVGVLAGIAFALNPFYLFVLIICESSVAIKCRKKLSLEAMIIIAIQLLYFISIFIFYPNYIDKILPLGYHVYLPGYSKSLFTLLTHPFTMFTLLTLFTSILFYRLSRAKELTLILILANVGFLLSFLIQKKLFYYHLLPLMIIATTQVSQIIYDLASSLKTSNVNFTRSNKMLALIFASLLLLCFPLFFTCYLTVRLHNYQIKIYQPFEKVIQEMTTQNQSLLFMTFYPSMIYTISLQTNLHVASRFDGFWFMPALIKFPERQSVQKYKNELFNLVAADIEKNKPEFIFIDKSKIKGYFKGLSFDYLSLLNQNKLFQKQFKRYYYENTLKKFIIYKRTET